MVTNTASTMNGVMNYLSNPWVRAVGAAVGSYYALTILKPAMLVNSDGSPKYKMFNVATMSVLAGAGVLGAYMYILQQRIGSPVAMVQPALDVVGLNQPTGGMTPSELLGAGEF